MSTEIIVAGFGSMGSAISTLFFLFIRSNRRVERKLDACERDRRDLLERIIKIEKSR